MTKIEENIHLAPHTILKIGGPARFFAEIKSVGELKEAVGFVRERKLPVFVLGEGSNIVVSDAGFQGLVLKNKILGLEVQERGDVARIKVGGGESWDTFVKFAVESKAAGVECLSGIPGTVGAAPVQNIGAYGQSVGEAVESVEAVDLETGESRTFSGQECEFGYRTSRFKKSPGRYFITSVSFRLKKGGAPALVYHDLKSYFGGISGPTLAEVRKAVLEIRSRKGMVVTGEELHTSVGSFFTNSVVTVEVLNGLKPKVEICRRERGSCAPPWFWERPDGRAKVSAACLVECAGFGRGIKIGKVGISPLHSLAIVNLGGASGAEVVSFAREIQNRVREKFEIALEVEPQFIGF